MCVHTVIRWTSNRRQIEMTLSPFVRAVRIASTSAPVSCVRDRLAGFSTTPDSGSTDRGSSIPMPSFACSHAALTRSNRFPVFGLSPPASTDDAKHEGDPARGRPRPYPGEGARPSGAIASRGERGVHASGKRAPERHGTPRATSPVSPGDARTRRRPRRTSPPPRRGGRRTPRARRGRRGARRAPCRPATRPRRRSPSASRGPRGWGRE